MIDWERTIALSISDQKSVVEKTLKTAEETGELAQAVLSSQSAHCCSYKRLSRTDIIIESVDVIQCAISVIAKTFEKVGFPEKDFKKIFSEKLDKWEIKQKEHQEEPQ